MDNITYTHSTLAIHADLAARAFHALHADGSAPFCLGSISLEDFTAETNPQKTWFLTAHREGQFLGYLCLSDWLHKSARIRFAIARAGRPHGVTMALHAFRMAFATGLHSIYGIFPASYRHIPPFARRLGGECLGVIPGFCWDSARGIPADGIVWVFLPSTIKKESMP